MYRANNDTTFVASKTVIIKPESEIDYTPTVNQIRFLLPSYLGYINPQATYLRYNIELSGRGLFKPNRRAGCHSLIRDIRITTGDSMSELESLQDYNVMTAMDWEYTGNKSITQKRSLFEGQSINTNMDGQLYWNQPEAVVAGSFITVNETPVKVAIQQPINNSGILGTSAKIFPVATTSGLRVNITLDSFVRSILANPIGTQDDDPWVLISATTAGGDNFAKDDNEKTSINQEYTTVIHDAYPGAMDATRRLNNPFRIGDCIMIENAGGFNECLGVINGFTLEGTNIGVKYIPNRPLGVGLGGSFTRNIATLFWKQSNRTNAITYADIGSTEVFPGQSYVISDLELITDQVQPPDGYVKGMMAQVASDKGLNIDYRTNTTYRNNVLATTGITSQHINTRETRAYSLLTRPLSDTSQVYTDKDSFEPNIDGADSYQFVIDGSLKPDRSVSLKRLSQDPFNKSEPLHLIEVEKAITNMGKTVRDLRFPSSNFVIGRGLSKYGQVSNLAKGDVALRVDYSATGGTSSKLFVHQVNHLNRLNISKNGSTVVR